jgi:hypothetical protein
MIVGAMPVPGDLHGCAQGSLLEKMHRATLGT